MFLIPTVYLFIYFIYSYYLLYLSLFVLELFSTYKNTLSSAGSTSAFFGCRHYHCPSRPGTCTCLSIIYRTVPRFNCKILFYK